MSRLFNCTMHFAREQRDGSGDHFVFGDITTYTFNFSQVTRRKVHTRIDAKWGSTISIGINRPLASPSSIIVVYKFRLSNTSQGRNFHKNFEGANF